MIFAALFVLAGLLAVAGQWSSAPQAPLNGVISPKVAGAPEAPASVVSGEDVLNIDALRRRIAEISGAHVGRYGVIVYEPVPDSTVSVGADQEFYAASIGKLPTLLALYRAADRGEADLDGNISILPEDVSTEGSGVLHTYPLYSTVSLRESAHLLMHQSDNTAWRMLDRYLGEGNIQDELETAGADATDYALRITTPADVLRILRKISDASYTSESRSREMLDHMTDTAYEDRIPASLPADLRVAHKIGSYGDSFGDAGIVFYKDADGRERSYYLVVLSDGTTESEARAAIQEISLATYEEIAQP